MIMRILPMGARRGQRRDRDQKHLGRVVDCLGWLKMGPTAILVAGIVQPSIGQCRSHRKARMMRVLALAQVGV